MAKCTRCPHEAEDERFKMCQRCRATGAAQRRRYVAKNPEQNHGPARAAAVRRWQAKNPERYKAWQANYHKLWKAKNRNRCRLKQRLRRAEKSGRVVRASTCSTCGRSNCRIVAYLDVQSLEQITWHCRSCLAKKGKS